VRGVGPRPQRLGRGEAVDPGHPDVHEHDVGRVGGDGGGHVCAVARLADDLDLVRAGEHELQAGARERVVVDDQDADALAHAASHGSQADSRNSPAIVAYFVLPTVWSILGETIPALERVAPWLDTSPSTTRLAEDTMSSGGDWARLGTSRLLWLALPLVVGAWRVRRSEVK
jgi:hypothetical protein